MSRRTERVGNLIRNILANALRTELSDPRIEPLTSITRVTISPDFAVAFVYVTVMAPEARRELCLRALRHSAGRLRHVVAEQITLRIAPRLDFRLDDSVRRGAEMVNELDRLMAEMGERPAFAAEDDADEPEIDALDDADPTASRRGDRATEERAAERRAPRRQEDA
ncbi:MAG: 30S ribosome-binding factor RbfA [Phycisphaerae bacterium]